MPDEARTFGMEALFRAVGIYSSVGQLYEPVDMDTLLYYKESKDGQILEEGITEAGSMSSFIAAGSCLLHPRHSDHPVLHLLLDVRIPAHWRSRVGCRATCVAAVSCSAAPAGRTTLAGEGLQHQDGNSHLLAYPVPNCVTYDPAFAYELAVIIQDGIKRMYTDGESIFYYITVMNEPVEMPHMPEGSREGILRGMYSFKKSEHKSKLHANLFGSGTIMQEVIKAAEILESKYDVATDIWSITSYKELYKDGNDVRSLEHVASRRNAESAVRHRAAQEMRRASSSPLPIT